MVRSLLFTLFTVGTGWFSPGTNSTMKRLNLYVSTLSTETKTMATKPIRTNNPFALIQSYGKASSWKGLIGQELNGFLVFDTVDHGLRAGFINLINTYLSKGRNTIEKIVPVYAPEKDANKPLQYIKFLEDYTKIPKNAEINEYSQVLRLGMGIVRMESGSHFQEKDMRLALDQAIAYTNFQTKIKVAAGGAGLLLAAAVAYGVWRLWE
jgi:hypothetical protein